MDVRDQETEDILALYLREVRKTPLLSRAEEKSLLFASARGDTRAKEKLLKANLRFVVTVARRYQTPGLPLVDLIGEGNVGLLNALAHFDCRAGRHFLSYAIWWIRHEIIRAVADKSRMIRLPENKSRKLKQIDMALGGLPMGHAQGPAASIAQGLTFDGKRLATLMSIPRVVVSLNAPLRTENDSSTVEDCLADGRQLRPEDRAVENALRRDISSLLAILPARESEILQSRYGLNGRREMSLEEIGATCMLTRERVRQIEKKALKRLRQCHGILPLRGYY